MKFLGGAVFGVLVVLAGGYLFVALGGLPVKTAGPPLPLERFITRTAIHAALRGQESAQPPFAVDEAHLLNGAKTYAQSCAGCHGLMNEPQSAFQRGMFPHPPRLFSGKRGVTDDPIGEIRWKIKYGIRLTGMPAFEEMMNDTQIWEVAAVLKNADQLSDPVKKALLPETPATK